MEPDGELLRRYVENGSEAAFAALVQRHINLVYRSALRRVGGNAHAADDVVQSVFSDLARKAPSLMERTSLAGWLYTGARFASAEIVRSEQRRRTHEQEAHQMNELNTPDVDATRLEPILDEVLDTLRERERDAVVMHFFEGLTFVQVGAVQSLAPDAARMRVNRALARIRAGLARRGIVSTAGALGAALSAQSAAASGVPSAATVAALAVRQASVSALLRTARWPVRWLQVAAGVGAAGVGIWAGLRWIAARKSAGEIRSSSTAPRDLPVAVAEASSEENPPTPRQDNAPTAAEMTADLSGSEADLLEQLWNVQKILYGGAPAASVRLPSPSENDAALENALHAKGLVRTFVGVKGFHGITLTAAGIAYCEKTFDQLPTNPPLSDLEKQLLVRLRMIAEDHGKTPAGVRYGLKFSTGDVVPPQFQRLVANGWVAMGPKGVAYITKAGVAFFDAHLASLAGTQAP